MVRKVILDVDTGIDDALALLLALHSPELEVVGVTCVAGNVTIDHVVRNTLAVLELAGAEVPVAVGAPKPLAASLRTATYFHGSNGLGEVQLPPPRSVPIAEDAAGFLARLVRQQPGEITVIAVGPLTNLALALLRDPQFGSNAANFFIMGGAISTPGNVSGAAEANFNNDPEAASAVAEAPAFIHLVDLGATTQAVLPPGRLESLEDHGLSPVGGFALQLLRFYSVPCMTAGAAGAILHDPLAVGLAILPDLATLVPLHLDVETGGRWSRGASIGNFSGRLPAEQPTYYGRNVVGFVPAPFNAAVPRNIDVGRFLDLFLTRLELVP